MLSDARRRAPKEKKRTADSPITVELLRGLFATKVLKGRLKMPGDADLKKLALILEGWRQSYLSEQSAYSLRERQDNARKALDKLREALSELRTLNKHFFENAEQDHAPASVFIILNRRLAEIKHALTCLSRIETATFLSESGIGAEGWMWLAGVLPQDFENAMRPANPTIVFGLGHGGPLARFIAAVVPPLTGESITAQSVSAQLKRRAARLRGK